MKRQILILITTGLIHMTSYCQNKSKQITEVEIWKLGWRVIESSMEENYELANLQFDSLRNSTKIIDKKYLVTGLQVKSKLGKFDEVTEIINSQDLKIQQEVCSASFLSGYEICKEYSIEKVDNKTLQIELIKMYLNDQYVRSNLMTNLLDKYKLTKNEVIIDSFGVNTDERNRQRLKQIIDEYGFPSKKLVGKDAMQGIFYMIQHSDGDKEWQKSQLLNIEKAVNNGDMDGQSYAYLYDRIQINGGKKQLYGTQFAKVDPIKKVVELADTEDLENVDKRRMGIGMMPIEMYKKFMLKNL